MTALEAIRARRTVRSYRSDPVPQELLMQVIDAARWAPTSGNTQPWEILRVITPSLREALVATTYGGYARTAPSQSWLLQAPELLVVLVNTVRTRARYGVREAEYAKLDVAAAIQNMLLAATSLGLGAAWIGGFRRDDATHLLTLDRELLPLGMVAIGYATGDVPTPHRLPLEDVLREV